MVEKQQQYYQYVNSDVVGQNSTEETQIGFPVLPPDQNQLQYPAVDPEVMHFSIENLSRPGVLVQSNDKLGGAVKTIEKSSFRCVCQFCSHSNTTRHSSQLSSFGWLFWTLMCFFFGFGLVLMCCLPCCVPDMNNHEFRCKGCKRIVAVNYFTDRL